MHVARCSGAASGYQNVVILVEIVIVVVSPRRAKIARVAVTVVLRTRSIVLGAGLPVGRGLSVARTIAFEPSDERSTIVPRLVVWVVVDLHDRVHGQGRSIKSSLFEILLRRRPGLVDVLQVLESAKLGYPAADISTLLVVLESLADGIEDAPVASWVVADTGDVLPVPPVGADIIVDEQHLVPLGTEAPVNIEVLRHETGYVLACTVRRVARVEKLALGGVDQAHPRSAILEPLD